MRRTVFLVLASAAVFASAGLAASYDVVIKSGRIYDGSGGAAYVGDVAIAGDRIAAVGRFEGDGKVVVDANGLAVAPGFINMLSWANDTLIEDGLSQSDIRQGVTCEIMGEGRSMGPLSAQMKADMRASQGDIKFDVAWTSLAEYLEYLERRGISTNVASFVGATTLRIHAVGYEDRRASRRELARMRQLAGEAMREGALGVSSSLIYAPGCYADTSELTALAKVAGEYGGMYISHIRSEGDRLAEGVDELVAIARRADVAAEIYHLKAAGEDNWGKLEAVIERIERARSEGVAITANMYAYTAAATGLDAAMPPWVQSGGHAAWVGRLRDVRIRRRVIREMRSGGGGWENFYHLAGGAERVVLTEFRNARLRHLTGKTLAEAARIRGQTAEETAIDLVIEDDSRVGAVYFLMSEANVRRQIGLSWMSFCSDAGSIAPKGVFLGSNPHPRAYGNFARLLGRYVRDEQVISPAEAVRRLSRLPAENLKLAWRGRLAKGYYADVVVFDAERIADLATYAEPHRYATGMRHVFVNGTAVLRDGEHTGARPGRFVRGPGWRK